MSMRLGELFAGYGGLGLAVEEVFGATTSWFSEFEDAPSRILAHHWPTVPNYGDVTKIDWANIEPVDIISGGSPCQDLSLAGRRKGMAEGTRSNLWESMREGIAIIRPKYVVWENVRGALSAGAISEMEQSEGRLGECGDPYLRALGRVLGDLADLGYDAEWRGLRAADVGATHNRFRVFLLAALPNAGGVGLEAGRLPSRPAQEVPESADHQSLLQDAYLAASSQWRIPASGQEESGRAWSDAGGRGRTLTANANGEPYRTIPGAALGYATGDGPVGSDGPRCGSGTPADATSSRCAEGQDARPGSENAGTGLRGLESQRGHGKRANTPTNPASIGRAERWTESARLEGGSDALLSSGQNWGDYEPAVRRWERINGPAPRPTEPSGRDNAHRLSPAFVEWMMGLPAGWVTDVPGVNRNGQLKALGNGVVKQQAVAALRDMLAAFELKEAA